MLDSDYTLTKSVLLVIIFFKSYLADRTQCVSVKGVMSEMNRLIYGVPQGSVLGPIEFCICTLPLSAS